MYWITTGLFESDILGLQLLHNIKKTKQKKLQKYRTVNQHMHFKTMNIFSDLNFKDFFAALFFKKIHIYT